MANAQYVYNYFTNHGYAPHHAAALTGNLGAESGFDSTVYNKQGSGNYGTAQWGGTRKTDLKNYAKENGQDPNAIDTQLGFVDYELHHKESKALEKLISTKNVDDATYAVGKYYERPSDEELSSSIGKRKTFAHNVYGSSGSGESSGAGGNSEDYSFESFKKSKPSVSNTEDYSYEGFKKPKEVSNSEDYSFESFTKNRKPKELTVTDNTTPETITPTTADSLFNAGGFTLNSVNKALAGVGDSVINAPVHVGNLLQAGGAVLANKAGLLNADEMPEPIPTPNVLTNAMTNNGLISTNPLYNPTTSEGRVADAAIQSVASGGQGVKNMAMNAVAGAVGQGVTEATDSEGAGLVANLVTGAVTKKTGNAISNTGKATLATVKENLPVASDKTIQQIAAKKTLKEINKGASTPYTPKTLQDALTTNPTGVNTGNLLNQPTLNVVNQNTHPIVAGLTSLVSKKIGTGVGLAVGSAVPIPGSTIAGGYVGGLVDEKISNKLNALSVNKQQRLNDAIQAGLVDPDKLETMLKTIPVTKRVSFLEELIPSNLAALPAANKLINNNIQNEESK